MELTGRLAGAWTPVSSAVASMLIVPTPLAALALGSAVVIGVALLVAARVLRDARSRAAAERRRADTLHARTLELERRVSEQAARLAELERELAERDRALEEAEHEAERVVRSKSDLLSRVSHELRTSLNALLGFAQLLETDSLSAAQRAHVDRILAAGRRLLEFVDKAVDFARIETGRLSLSSEPVPVGETLERTLDAVRPLAAGSRVQVRAEGAGARAQYVRADPDRLAQVLLALCSNAIKFNREGGLVTLACEERGGHRLRILVRDTGSGIPPGAMEKLFAPFERLRAQPADGPGTGLTVALCRRLVEAMGGAMGAESTPGEGSTFWVELPVAEGPARRSEGEEPPQPPQPKDRYTVLYIEDNLINLKLVEDIIVRRPRVHLISALQGRRGLELAQDHRPDLILLDLNLPDIQGDELLRRLRQNPDTRRIPVVVISAEALPTQIRRILDAGARAYLTKPIDVAKLLALVDEILSGGPAGEAGAPGGPSTAGGRGRPVVEAHAGSPPGVPGSPAPPSA